MHEPIRMQTWRCKKALPQRTDAIVNLSADSLSRTGAIPPSGFDRAGFSARCVSERAEAKRAYGKNLRIWPLWPNSFSQCGDGLVLRPHAKRWLPEGPWD